jgi:acetyl esterase/lipase
MAAGTRVRKLIACGIIALGITAVSVWGQTASYETQLGIETDDVVYRKVNGRELRLDIETPKPDGTTRPVVMFLCGNAMGYYNFDRGQFTYGLDLAVSKGYVGVTVDYSTSGRKNSNGRAIGTFPAQVYDVKSAIRFLRANAKGYNIDPDHIGVMGWSSGGLLAMMLALTRPTDELEGEDSNSSYPTAVQAAVSFGGETDLSDSPDDSSVAYIGASPKAAPDLYRRASPITYVRSDAPPILSVVGDQDNCLESSIRFDKKMQEAGAAHTLLIKKGIGHEQYDTEDKIVWDFLDKYLKK